MTTTALSHRRFVNILLKFVLAGANIVVYDFLRKEVSSDTANDYTFIYFMNYLAHCFLSCSDDNLLIGNMVADMIRNKDLDNLDPAIVKGVMLHREIDSFTDNHPATRRTAKLLHERHGKYAPVVTDIFYDYILYQNWGIYSDTPFDTFKATVYHQIKSADLIDLPEKVQGSLGRMVEGNWLDSYTTIRGMDYVFSRVALRAKFDSNILTATRDLLELEEALDEGFHAFFPDIQARVKEFCGC